MGHARYRVCPSAISLPSLLWAVTIGSCLATTLDPTASKHKNLQTSNDTRRWSLKAQGGIPTGADKFLTLEGVKAGFGGLSLLLPQYPVAWVLFKGKGLPAV